MVAFYKHYIKDWRDDTGTLTNGEYRAYHVIVEAIYFNEGPVVRNERGLAGMCNQRQADFRRNLETLLTLGLLEIVGDRITNRRCEAELAEISVNRQNASKGGRQSAANRHRAAHEMPSKRGRDRHDMNSNECQIDGELSSTCQHNPANPLKINDAGQAPLPNALKPKREEEEKNKTREDNKENAQARDGANAPSFLSEIDNGWPEDAFERFWSTYPNKVNEKAAEKKFNAIRRSNMVAWADLWSGLLAYANKRDERAWCNPETWLHQERWNDLPAQSGSAHRPFKTKGRYYSP